MRKLAAGLDGDPGWLLAPGNGDYGGNLLAKTIYATTTTYALATNAAALSAANLTVGPFTAPASGAVTVRLTGLVVAPSGNYVDWLLFLHNTTTIVGYSQMAINGFNPSASMEQTVTMDIEVTALTPGNAYQFDWAATAFTTGASVLVGSYAGSAPSAGNAGPGVMKVFAA